MKNSRRILFMGLCFTFLMLLFAGPAISVERITIVGIVNDDYQIVTADEKVYEVAETEKGDRVVELVGKKVKVTGTVEESEGTKIITVAAYEVLED